MTESERDKHMKFVEWLKEYHDEDRMIDSEDLLVKERNRKSTGRITTKVFPKFDEVASGFEPGELIVIGGGTSQGKSLLLLSILNALSRNSLNTALFSYELTARQILERFGWLPPMFYTPNEIAKFKEPPIKGLKDCSWYLPNFLDQDEAKWVWLKAWELKCRKDNPVIPHAMFLDHLLFMVKDNGPNVSWNIGMLTRSLKKVAVDMNLMIFLATHSTKEMVEGGELHLNDLWGSSFISQDADTVLIIWNDKSEKGVTNKFKLKLAKHRYEHGTNAQFFKLVRVGNFLVEEYE